MFISKKRIDEDLQIFKRSLENPFPEEASQKKGAKERQASLDDSQEPFTFSEFVALCGAAFAVIMPWVIAFSVAMGIVGWLLILWLS